MLVWIASATVASSCMSSIGTYMRFLLFEGLVAATIVLFFDSAISSSGDSIIDPDMRSASVTLKKMKYSR